VILNLDRSATNGVALNRQLIGGYVQAFRAAADEFGWKASRSECGFANAGCDGCRRRESGDELEAAVMERVEEALFRLNEMREQEGRSISTELRARMASLAKAAAGSTRIALLFCAVIRSVCSAHGGTFRRAGRQRTDLQEVALLVDRSDIQEELVRLNAHVKHFSPPRPGGEVGKKMDFLLQEMNREANTMLSKTSAWRRGIESHGNGPADEVRNRKIGEQVQNLE